MVNRIPVPQAKYELLTTVRQTNWKSPVVCLTFVFIIVGTLFAIRVCSDILTPRNLETGPLLEVIITTEDATIASWTRRARMYAESSKENQNADRNTTIVTSSSSFGSSSSSKILVCYYTLPRTMNTTKELSPALIDPNICTHIIVGFASVVNSTLSLGANTKIYYEISSLKKLQPKLKVMISAGGINELTQGFPEMVKTHANRKKFIRSVLNITKALNLDGLDVDWEFPAWLGNNERQKIWFVQLLQELRKEFDRSGRTLILSAAVAAPPAIVDESYFVPNIAEHVDFVNLMAYDYHYYVWYLPITGLNAPLYPRSSEMGYSATLNVNYSAHYWISKGMPRDKIVIGIPTYGHSYQLDNTENHGIMAPARGFGRLGVDGFVFYPMICWLLGVGGNKVYDEESQAAYVYRYDEWISYEDEASVAAKVEWIKANDFRGAMIFSLNTDDWSGSCTSNDVKCHAHDWNSILRMEEEK
ncbi:chitinase-3-like protein 2 isoform X2 [Microplitis demolitor]|uniref:chitinase-3-like protein 2 isoform X2 n=1 Tax=Microplitis demolitor TaxID=69319 RepID=UPI0004CDC984|nr:chitinase-3-like protein 2 isoform X2 [Microplitis demolitor]